MAWPEVAKTTWNVCRGHSVRGFSLHAESNNRPPTRTLTRLKFSQHFRLQVLRISNHLAASNLFVSRAVKTQFADSQPAVRSYGRTERAARHWPGIVKVAQPRFRIEHRTGLVVRKFLEALFRLRTFVEHSRFRVAGKLRRQPLNRISRPRSNTARLLRVRLFEVRELAKRRACWVEKRGALSTRAIRIRVTAGSARRKSGITGVRVGSGFQPAAGLLPGVSPQSRRTPAKSRREAESLTPHGRAPCSGPRTRGSRADASIDSSGITGPFCHLSQMNMYRSVPKVPDFPAMEREMLRFWKEHRIFEKLWAQTAGGPRWSFLDGPITANNPMGVHHAWGRSLKEMYQRYHDMSGQELRYQNGFDCQGLWVEVEVEKSLGLQTKREIRDFGIENFVRACKERVLTFAARQTEQSVRLGYWCDWDDPKQLIELRDALADGDRVVTATLPSGHVETARASEIVRKLGSLEYGGSYFTFSDENNYTIWAFLKKCHSEGRS